MENVVKVGDLIIWNLPAIELMKDFKERDIKMRVDGIQTELDGSKVIFMRDIRYEDSSQAVRHEEPRKDEEGEGPINR